MSSSAIDAATRGQLRYKRPPYGVVLSAILTGMIAIPAMAAPPPNADGTFAPWFRSLRIPGSDSSCCDESDCRRTVAEMAPYGWKAKTLFGWIPIPRRIILYIPNPTGEAILCWTPNRGPLCFVPPPGS